MKTKILVVWAVLLVSMRGLNAQDPHFSQFYSAYLQLNPALTGSSKCPLIMLNYRNQWPALNQAFVTYSAAFDLYSDNLNGGLGFFLYNDQQAENQINTFNFSSLYSYSIKISETFDLKAGFQASYIHRRLNWEKIILPDMINPITGSSLPTSETPPELSKSFLDFSAGVVGYGRNYYFGLAVHHLNTAGGLFAKKTYKYLPPKYTVHFGAQIPLFRRGLVEPKLILSPSIVYQRQQNYEQINYGLFLARKLFVLGVWRQHDLKIKYGSYIFLIGFVYSKFRIAYSYDMSAAEFGSQALDAHEVSFSLQLNCRKKQKKFKPVPCPAF